MVVRVLNLKVKLFDQVIHWNNIFISSKNVMAFRSYCWFCEKYIFISPKRWSIPGWKMCSVHLYLGINPSPAPLKSTPLILAKPPLKSANCPSPLFFKQPPPPRYQFFVISSSKSWILQWKPKITQIIRYQIFRLYRMDSNSVKNIKKLFTEMFNDHHRKMCDMYHGFEKSIREMI